MDYVNGLGIEEKLKNGLRYDTRIWSVRYGGGGKYVVYRPIMLGIGT